MKSLNVRLVMMCSSLLWMGSVYGQQGLRELEALRDAYQQHLIVSAKNIEKIEAMERRVTSLEEAARADKFDSRVTRVEEGIATLKFMVFSLGIPLTLMGVETVLRFMQLRKSNAARLPEI